ncbi:ethanolamine utilization protein EutH [Clostridium ganghwense]|uniref:Ethanolamine utilization protein EutH n=1 Tax=Clostridium ganghwense TaxID=312089 RepID=A0ABT4CKK0_9CLOT|nr:ethanolamine utilization protein EutH [Clostridium ganghwense]MCY6369580.1 ethanolamine utilization protein EutH [Clostridium ganghwense]
MNKVILYIIIFFAVLGSIDKIIGNKFGLGKKFDEGFMAMGNLALGIIGIYSMAPILANGLLSIIAPIFKVIGVDPSISVGSLLACDMGGYSSAMEIAKTRELGMFSGLLIASMLGATIVYTIPIAIGVIEKEDHPFFIKGILAGIITIPIGALIGGILSGMNILVIIKNLIPIIIFSIILAIGLIKQPEKIMKSFAYFNKIIAILGTIGLIAGIFQRLTGITLIHGMKPLQEGLSIVVNISIFLAGAYPMMFIITKLFTKPLSKVGEKVGIEENAVIGLIISLANNIPAFVMLKDMDKRGKVICSAFAVSGAFSFGGQMGFVASVESSMIVPVMIGKLTAGISGVILAYFLTGEEVKDSSCVMAKNTQ